MGALRRLIKGICVTCWGAGQVETTQGKRTCPDCGGKGEREFEFERRAL